MSSHCSLWPSLPHLLLRQIHIVAPTARYVLNMFENDVDVRLARGNGNAIRYCEKDEFENDGGSKRITFTRLVYEKPAIDVAIHLNFGSDFDLYSADGVAILLSWDSTSVKGYREKQLFWIDKADVTTEFVVKSTKGFSPITGAVSSWQLNMPAQSGDTTACSSVWRSRG